jgi:monovalent cation/hydrogen antiporter
LIGFKYAVAATMYGVFSLRGAIVDFIYISLIGAIVGIITMSVISIARKWLYKSGLISVPFNVVLQIVSPFAIYLLSEDVFHASGVIAVVTAGVVYHVNGINLQASSAELMLVSEKSWDIIIYLLNGIVFLILGIELPFAMQAVVNSMKFNTLRSIGYAIIMWLILLVIRCIWIILYEIGRNLVTQKNLENINIKAAIVVGFSGVRGAITMAGVLSIPLLNSQGNPFPDRDLILFIASMVIVLSLLAAVIALPLIVKTNRTVEYNNDNYWNEEKTRIFVLNYAINEIKSIKQVDKHIVNIIVDQYELMIRQLSSIRPSALQLKTRNLAVDFEHKAVRNLILKHKINKREANIINYHINHRELKNSLEFNQFNLKLELISAFQTTKLWFFNHQSDDYQQKRIQLALIQVNEYTINRLQQIDSINASVINAIVDEYINFNDVLKTKSFNYTEDYRFVKEQALFAQRNGIQDLIAQDKISVDLAAKLRQEINYIENNELNS